MAAESVKRSIEKGWKLVNEHVQTALTRPEKKKIIAWSHYKGSLSYVIKSDGTKKYYFVPE